MHGALEELGLVEEQVEMTRRVEFGILVAVDVVHVLVEHANGQHRQRRVKQVVHRDEHRVKDRLEEQQKRARQKHKITTVLSAVHQEAFALYIPPPPPSSPDVVVNPPQPWTR